MGCTPLCSINLSATTLLLFVLLLLKCSIVFSPQSSHSSASITPLHAIYIFCSFLTTFLKCSNLFKWSAWGIISRNGISLNPFLGGRFLPSDSSTKTKQEIIEIKKSITHLFFFPFLFISLFSLYFLFFFFFFSLLSSFFLLFPFPSNLKNIPPLSFDTTLKLPNPSCFVLKSNQNINRLDLLILNILHP